MNDNILTIIVPVYNTPIEHLMRCFDSLKNQSCKDFELVVVDGGSKASVAMFLDELYASFEHINVVHINHCGVSATRNRGLELVSTPYVAFGDSDDEYSLDFVKEAKEYAERYEPDIVFGTISCVPQVNLIQTDSQVYFFDNKDEIKEFYKAFLDIPENAWRLRVFPSQCGRVYLSSLACSTMFDENVSYGEDMIFNRKCLAKAQSILMVPNSWYIYYANDYSVTHQKNNSFFQVHKPYYDAFYDLNKSEDLVMQRALFIPQYQSFFSVMHYDIIGEGLTDIFSEEKRKSFFEKKEFLKDVLNHPYFGDAFEGLRGSHDIGFVDRVFVYLVNHRMYRLLIFCCRIGIFLRSIKRKVLGQERF